MKSPVCQLCGNLTSRNLFSSKDYELGQSKQEFNYVECLSCGLVYLFPLPEAKEIPEYYPVQYYSKVLSHREKDETSWRAILKRWVRIHYWKWPDLGDSTQVPGWIAKIIVYPFRYIPAVIPYRRSAKILDIGCGNGEFLKELRHMDQELQLVGLEPGIEQTNDLDKFRIKKICSTVAENDLGSENYDVITAWDVIEHLPDPISDVRKIYASLKKDGYFICGTPNINNIEVKLFKGESFIIKAPRHLYLFKKKTLKMLLRKAGFQSVKVVRNWGNSHLFYSYLNWCEQHNRKSNKVMEFIYQSMDKLGMGTGLRGIAVK